MTFRKIIKINSIILVFLIFSILGNNTVVIASEGHEEIKIDISNGYTSSAQILEWKEQVIFEFEVTEAADYTFEIYNIDASLTYFSFNHEDEHETALDLLDSGDEIAVVKEGETLNHDNLPVGAHIEIDVLRHLKITEVGNYTLTFDNEHVHEADSVKFEFKFTVGLVGDEKFGTMVTEEEDTPGFGLIFSIATLFIAVFGKRKFQRSEQL